MKTTEMIDIAVEKYAGAYWARPFVSAIPYVGGPIDALISGRGGQIQYQRVMRFIEQLRDAYAQLEENKIDKAFIESDEFFDFFIGVFERVIRVHGEEKLKALRNAFVNATTKEGSGGEFKDIVIRVAGELSATHMQVLRVISEKQSTFTAADRENQEDYTDFEHIKAKLPALTDVEIEIFSRDLIAMGLLESQYVGRWGDADSRGRVSLTPFGERFVWFITLPQDRG